MKRFYPLVALAALALPLHASIVTLTFEGLQDSESVDNYYNGGAGSAGSIGGTNYGVTFSPDATAFVQTLVGCTDDQGGGCTSGGTGLFGGEPSPVTAMMFCDSLVSPTCGSGTTSQTIDVAAGFVTFFSLYYSAPFTAGQLDIYSGLDGAGTDLATLILPATPAYDSNNGCNVSEYGAAADPGAVACPFIPVSVSFEGLAESVVFTGATDSMFIDDISFDNTIPEPPTWLMVLSVSLGAMCFRARFAKPLRGKEYRFGCHLAYRAQKV